MSRDQSSFEQPSVSLHPESALVKLGFDLICRELASHCVGDEARAEAMELPVLTEREAIIPLLDETAELQALLNGGENLPLASLPSVIFLLDKASVEGNWLSPEEAARFWRWLELGRRMRGFLLGRRDRCPTLSKRLPAGEYDSFLIDLLPTILSPEGHVLSTASSELRAIRKALADKAEILRQQLERILRNARSQGWTEARELTLRNERLVIPLLTDFKSRVAGLIHDVSGSGLTVYIEPFESVSLNNDLRELRAREQQEIVRILTEFTGHVRHRLPSLWNYVEFLTALDLAQARARLAQRLGASKPEVNRGDRIELVAARHPLLVLQKGANKVMPFGLKLDRERRILLISGPNAGGKSVALAAVGLIQLMLQAGLLVPASPDSSLPLLGQVFVDMGDDQSLQNDLSTYSSHLQHMQVMLDQLRPDALFLIDEFGSGTDPELGGPIAEALLEELVERRAFGIITTHFGNLKSYAARTPTLQNAAMQFDLVNLTPTYVLEVGLPGSSHAIELAQRAGIAEGVLDRARSFMGHDRADVELLVARLRQQEQAAAEHARSLTEREARAARIEADLNERRVQVDKQRRKILEQARHEAAQRLKDANTKIEATIREIKELNAEAERTRQLRRELEKDLLLAPEPEAQDPEQPQPEAQLLPDAATSPIQVGEWVQLRSSDARGQVVDLRGGRAVVSLGDSEMRTTVSIRELVRTAPPPGHAARSNVLDVQRAAQSTQANDGASKSEVDLRGLTIEPALTHLDRFMDRALLAGVPLLTVLHGKGSGALRNAIRQHLRTHYPQVVALADGPDPGPGNGVTVVTL